MSVNGGDALESPISLKSPNIWDISPDHSQLLVASREMAGAESSLWTVPLPAGSPRRLGSLTTDSPFGGNWSADGRDLVFAKGSDLWIARQMAASRAA